MIKLIRIIYFVISLENSIKEFEKRSDYTQGKLAPVLNSYNKGYHSATIEIITELKSILGLKL